jgi:hypothetical protein
MKDSLYHGLLADPFKNEKERRDFYKELEQHCKETADMDFTQYCKHLSKLYGI